MKAIIIPGDKHKSIELISESEDERKQLQDLFHDESLQWIRCEEWRELQAIEKESKRKEGL